MFFIKVFRQKGKTLCHSGFMPVFIFMVLTLAVLTLSRILLIWWQNGHFDNGSDVLYVLLQGIRVDIATVCALLGPLCIAFIVINIARVLNRYCFLGLRLWFALAFALVIMNEAATPGFILEYGVRPNNIYVQYLMYPKEVAATLWNGHKLAVILSLLLTAAAFGFAFKVSGILFKGFIPASLKTSVVIATILLAALPLGVRSTLGHRPLNPAMVSFSDDPLLNSLPLNSTYSAVYALVHLDDERLTASQIYAFDTDDNILRAGRSLSAVNSPEKYVENNPFSQHIVPKAARRHNIVIILEESLGADFVESLGGLPVTPHLESLKDEGWWFENLYAAGHRSIRGIEAVFASFPPSPLNSIVKLPQPHKEYATLGSVLVKAGYKTMFIYGGESHFDNMRSFFLQNGMGSVIDENDYENPAFVASWGVSDEDLFTRANAEFDKQYAAGNNFFSLVFTSSFHDPFDIPEGKVDVSNIETKEPLRLAAAKYADFALGKFFAQAKKSAYYKDTVFLIIADHESRVRGSGAFPLKEFLIPGLIIGDEVMPQKDARIVSQIDMAPTLLSLAGVDCYVPFVGQDLTQTAVKERAIMQFNQTFGLLKKDGFITLSPGVPAHYFALDDKKRLHPIKEIPGRESEAKALLNLGPFIYYNNYQNIDNVRISFDTLP